MAVSTVYVVQEPPKIKLGNGEWQYKYDIAKAEKFGEIRIVFTWREARELQPHHMLTAARSRLCDFQPDDKLMIIGSPTAIIICAAVADALVENLNLLLHDRSIDDYGLQVLPSLNKENNDE